MPKPTDIFAVAAVLCNDAAQTQYNSTTMLPMLNLSLDILQEIYELHGIPTTNSTSSVITLKAGVTRLGFDTTPALPSDLIEIQQLWESPHGINEWTPVDKKEFIPHYIEDGTLISQFLIWAWEKQQIKLIAANQDNDLKIDYTGKIFNTPILTKDIAVNLPFTNIGTFLEFETASLSATFLGENPTRGQELGAMAGDALSRALGIPIKGMQSIVTRRKPFRHSFKHRGIIY